MESPGWLSIYSAVVCARAESGTTPNTVNTASKHAALRFANYGAGADAAGGSGACGVVEGLLRAKRTRLKTTIHTRPMMGETNRE